MARIAHDSRMYQGSPRDLINTISREITDALNQSGTHASSIHALAMLHVAACLIREVTASTDMGKAPSFKSILSVVMRGIDGAPWTNEELREFDEDFVQIVESLGGVRLGDKPAEKQADPLIMGPSLGVH